MLLFAAGCAFNPDLNPQPLNPSASTRVLAADGSQLALLDAGIHRQPITLSQMAHPSQRRRGHRGPRLLRP